MKKTLNEVIAANQTVTSLQAGQQELEQRAASVLTSCWHAQAAAMKYQMVAQPKGTTGSVKSRPAARAEVRAAPKPDVNAPLQLTAPRP